MYRSFEIKNFRCFDALKLENLTRVNLVVGKNNAGKTSLLEALFLHCGAYNPVLTLNVNAFRGIEIVKVEPSSIAQTPWDSLFYNFNTSKPIELKGEFYEKGQTTIYRTTFKIPRERSELEKTILSLDPKLIGSVQDVLRSQMVQLLELSYEEECHEGLRARYYLALDPKDIRLIPAPPPPPFPAIFLPSSFRVTLEQMAEQFSALRAEKRHEKIVSALRIIEAKLRSIEILTIAGKPMLHGDIGLDRLVPLPFMGEGIVRLASFLLSIATNRRGVVLIDEVEIGFHHSILQKVWQSIATLAREFEVQIFATTHSLECLIAAHKVFTEDEVYDFKLYRLDRVEDKIEVVAYEKDTLDAALNMEIEVR